MWESAEGKPVAPRTGPNSGVRTNHEVIVSGGLEAFNHDEVICGIRRPVNSGRALLVVEHLIQNDLSIAVFPGWRIPLQSNAC